MEMLGNFLLQTITSTAFSLVFLTGVGWLLRTWIGNRIHLSIKNQYDNKLERLKAELKTESDAHHNRYEGRIRSTIKYIKNCCCVFL